MLVLTMFTSLVNRLLVAGMAYSRMPIRQIQGNVHSSLSLVCVHVCVHVSLSLARRGGKTLDATDGGKQQDEEV